MEARIVGPEAELGDVRNGVSFYGQTLTRDWSKVDLSPEAQAKAQGNKYVELREGKKVQSTVPDDTEEETVKTRLTELGVEYGEKDKLPALKSKLDKAEKARAQAEKEADEAAAEAERLAAEAGRQPNEQ